MEKGRGIIPIVYFYVYNDEDSPIVCPGKGERKKKTISRRQIKDAVPYSIY